MWLAIQQVGSILFHSPVFLTGRVRTTTCSKQRKSFKYETSYCIARTEPR